MVGEREHIYHAASTGLHIEYPQSFLKGPVGHPNPSRMLNACSYFGSNANIYEVQGVEERRMG